VGVFLPPEWGNFVCVARKRPWLWPRYAGGLMRLVFRRFASTLRLRISGSDHRGLKRWPSWLGSRIAGEIVSEYSKLSFPEYPFASRERSAQSVPQLRFDANDPEAYFARHRWGNCFLAVLESDAVAEAALADALLWIQNSPPKNDAAWEPYSSCERVVNLAVMLSVHPGCRRTIEAKHEAEVADFFAESIGWINSHLEYYGIARTNNHILNNARALVVAGSVLGNEAVVERGLLLFARMAKELFQPGGFLRERSSHYQCVVTNWLLDTLHFAHSVSISRKLGRRAMAELVALSESVSRATALLVSACDGLNTHIGDISPDNHPAAATLRLRCLYPRVFAEACGSADGRRDDWLFVSNRKHRLLTCGMPIEYPLEYTTHGHSDLGSFVWAYDRQPVLVDSGRSSYLNDTCSRLQSGPAGHNVLTVQGMGPLSESLLANGRWYPRPYAKAAISFEHKTGAGFFLKHDGFARIPGLGPHSRSVLIEGEGIAVLDTLEGTGVVDVEIYWHFAPGLLPLEKSRCSAVVRGLWILVEEDGGDLEPLTFQWEEYPYAAAYGDVQQAFVLHTKRTVSLPWSVRTTLKVMQCAE